MAHHRQQVLKYKKEKKIVELRYWDQVDNETTYELNDTKFNQKIAGEKFSYTPPKNAEVITYWYGKFWNKKNAYDKPWLS